ncbi:MAG: patatin-like phospholipase family protein [Acidobacteria bacterium Pan2503]|uniref:Patatin-like phospholipase family protein n=1 Tax=Candidatus Acidiferrum panamense TaxID=2741543 RepID=A0A7V8NPE6_9BACT|nr:patatin-like phospholipase family protein [Candidatus Acidoferrum panamensis]
MSVTRRALVLGGGGFVASAWEVGLISGVAATGIDLRDYDMFLGTSSGARVALHLASGSGLDELFHQQLGPLPSPPASTSTVDWQKVRAEWARAKEIGGGSAAILRRVGALALGIAGSGGGDRRKAVAAQLPVQTWPEKALVMVGVNAETGERRAFDRNTGVELVDAVMATTAFWGWPPAFFEGYHYIDGGFYSSDNADVASGFDQVLILALRPPVPSLSVASLDEAVESLRAGGAQVEVVHPDEDCLEAFASVGGPMNPAVRAPAAKAGRAQGQRLGEGGLLSKQKGRG